MTKGPIDYSDLRNTRPPARTALGWAVCSAAWTSKERSHLAPDHPVGEVLKQAEVVFDKFHVLQHAIAALDEVRRQEFFRAGAVMREHGRGKRWLLLRRWKTVRGSKRRELEAPFAANRRLFKAYVLREQLDRLWSYKTRRGVLDLLLGWIRALRWQRLPEMARLGDCMKDEEMLLLKSEVGLWATHDILSPLSVARTIATEIAHARLVTF